MPPQRPTSLCVHTHPRAAAQRITAFFSHTNCHAPVPIKQIKGCEQKSSKDQWRRSTDATARTLFSKYTWASPICRQFFFLVHYGVVTFSQPHPNPYLLSAVGVHDHTLALMGCQSRLSKGPGPRARADVDRGGRGTKISVSMKPLRIVPKYWHHSRGLASFAVALGIKRGRGTPHA